MSRETDAIKIRDAALRKLKWSGSQERRGPDSVIVWRDERHGIELQWRTELPASLRGMVPIPGPKRTLACGLDIWTPKAKVLNIEWEADRVDLISFRRGEWEQVVLVWEDEYKRTLM